MKTAAIQLLRAKVSAGRPAFGLWVTLESASISEMAVALGLDWIVIDAEHGHLDWGDILDHIRATVRSNTVALVRVTELNAGLIKRALDIGADGIVIPWIESPEQLQQAVAFANYPPEGSRGIGAERATGWGECFRQHAEEANENVIVAPVIETVTAGKNIAKMCRVPGVDFFFLGPADYSSSAGYRGQWEGPGVAESLASIREKIIASGKHCGIVTSSPQNAQERCRQGFRLVGLGLDSGLILRGLHGALQALGEDRAMQTSFIPGPKSAAGGTPTTTERITRRKKGRKS
jgi:2-keto-3-deoxy-L-rhamnonate aldolase RhmA